MTDAFSINIFPAPSKMHSSTCRCRQSSSLQLLSSTTAVVHNNDRPIRRLVIRCDMSTTDDQRQQHEDIQAESSTITTTTTEQQLQKRFEDAMQRRKERRKEVATSSTSTTIISEVDVASSSIEEVETETSDTKDTIANIDIESQSTNVKDGDNKDNKPISTQGRQEEPAYNGYNYRQNSRRRPSSKTIRSSNKMKIVGENEIVEGRQRYNRYFKDKYDDPYDVYSEDPYDDNIHDDEYDDDDDDDEGYSFSTRRSSKPKPAPQCEWETYRSTSILFPPQQLVLDQTSSRDGIRRRHPTRPNAIIHFVGGTFFGSYPRKFYGSLLEDIACKCNAVVVATPIPLVLPGKGIVNKLEKWMFDEGGSGDGRRRRSTKERATKKNNPLDHLMLAETIQKEFNNVYRDVILDEYCDTFDTDESEVEDFMKTVPIIGIGHSLGARIQAISCSHPNISKRYLSMGKGNRLIRSGREGMIYLGFANWGASSSIPGLETLDRTVQKRRQQAQQGYQQRKEEQSRRRRREGVGRRDDVWDDRSRTRRRQRSPSYDEIIDENKRRRYSRYYDRYDAEDLDLADVFGDVVSSVTKGAQQIGEALTPEAEDLEFTPTPNELWDDLSAADGWYSQSSRSNLIVQFDEDPIDQGSRLARTLLSAYEAESEKLNATKSSDVEGDEPLHDVKFARLSGGHLTPVTLQEGIAKIFPRRAVSLLSTSYNFVLRQFDDERSEKSNQKQRREVQDVADTVASYIESLTDS